MVTQMVKNLPAMQKTQVQPLGGEDPLEEIATHSSILAMDRGTWWATVHGVAGVGHAWAINPIGEKKKINELVNKINEQHMFSKLG